MTGLAYYNEHDPYAAAWLRSLIAAGHIAPGHVDERDIRDVHAGDLDGYAQCHFFAGVGVWSYALRLAGWPDTRPVWTASCPCQPLSSAGLQLGHVDERHLWPALHGLIAERGPAALFGEQVASKDGREWFAAVRSDLEHLGYACGAADLAAAGVGAPHIRQRIFFVADTFGERREWGQGASQGRFGHRAHAGRQQGPDGSFSVHQARGRLGDASGARGGRDAGAVLGAEGESAGERCRTRGEPDQSFDAGATCGVGLTDREGREPREHAAAGLGHGRSALAAGRWREVDWIACRDGKARPVEPGTFPLAHGAPARVGRLRAYGNAIVAPLVAEFIGAVLDLQVAA